MFPILNSPSHLPPHIIPLGHPSAPAPRTLYHASNLDWQFISHVIIYMFQWHSPISSCPRPLPQSPKDCSVYLCLFCCLTYRVIITLFPLNYFFIYLKNLFMYFTLQYCIGFAIHWLESAMSVHVFPILNPPLSSLPIPSFWVISVHQPQASCIMHWTWTGDLFPTWFGRMVLKRV